MISLLKGTVQSFTNDAIVLMTAGGVGYEIKVKSEKLKVKSGEEVSLYTYLKVSENAMELYGFETMEEKAFFSLLLSVSGVGPKSAVNILSLGSIENIQDAILRKDVQYLTAVQGMGKKTAERLVVELKSKIKKNGSSNVAGGEKVGDALSEVIDGLAAMGYSKEEAKAAAQALDPDGKSTEALLREALRSLSR